jgi:hypothetical protein
VSPGCLNGASGLDADHIWTGSRWVGTAVASNVVAGDILDGLMFLSNTILKGEKKASYSII